MVDLREDIKNQKIQEDIVNEAMINLESDTEVESEGQTGYSWSSYLAMMTVVGLGSFATYKFT